jgi:hypothetical protein
VCPATPFLGKAVSFQLYDTADVDFLLAYGGDGVYYLPLDGETTALAPIETLRSFEGAAFAVSESYLYTKARTVKKYQLSASGTVLTALDNPETVSLPGDYEARFESSRHFIVLEDGTLCYTASDGSNMTTEKFSIYVYSKGAPQVSLNGEVPKTGKVGELIKLPTLSYKGSISNLTTVIYVVAPNGSQTMLEGELSFQAQKAGTYQVVYYVVEDVSGSYNYQLFNYQIQVRG